MRTASEIDLRFHNHRITSSCPVLSSVPYALEINHVLNHTTTLFHIRYGPLRLHPPSPLLSSFPLALRAGMSSSCMYVCSVLRLALFPFPVPAPAGLRIGALGKDGSIEDQGGISEACVAWVCSCTGEESREVLDGGVESRRGRSNGKEVGSVGRVVERASSIEDTESRGRVGV